jgi:predicted lipoprotein with Yx(FWY)xxD motif
MRPAIPVIVIVTATALVVAAAAAAPKRAPVLLHKTTVGSVLADGRGRTLYLFDADRSAKSSCYAQCAAAWPPYLATGAPLARSGARQALLKTTKRKDGKLQVVYAGHPLYFFSGDKGAGTAKGQSLSAFGGTGAAVTARGSAAQAAPATTPMPTPTDPGGGYGGGYSP